MSAINANKNFTQAAPYMKLIRDCVTGEPALKSPQNRQLYLPPPPCDEQDTEGFKAIYKRFVNGAEYDNVPNATLEGLLGAVSRQPNDYSGIPSSMSYIIDDADGDGLSLDEHVKIVQAELLQMKFCGLIADYSDLAGMGINDEELTRAQVKALGLRSSIKIYPRDSILNFDFRRVNGVKQLSFILLREKETLHTDDGFEIEEVFSYLILALDEDGQYYQIKRVEGEDDWSERFYPETPSGYFDYIPFEFAIQGNYPKGVLPDALGYIQSICSKSLARYNVNAQMKEALWFSGAPVSWSSGWTPQAFKIYKEMTGKDYISAGAGAHIPLAAGANYGVMDWQAESSAFFTYLDRNAKEIKALGGAFDVEYDNVEQTATASIIASAEKNSVLTSLQAGIEKAYERIIESCAKFEGLDVDVEIKLNREFMNVKLTPQERDAIRNDYMQGLIGRDEVLRQLENGGVLTRKAKELLDEIELTGE